MTSRRSGSAARVRRAFSREFKQEAVRLLGERRAVGMTLSQVGRELGVRPDQLRRWAGEMADRGVVVHAGAGETPEQELRRLRREVETLRQERDFAKKAAVFFAKESR